MVSTRFLVWLTINVLNVALLAANVAADNWIGFAFIQGMIAAVSAWGCYVTGKMEGL